MIYGILLLGLFLMVLRSYSLIYQQEALIEKVIFHLKNTDDVASKTIDLINDQTNVIENFVRKYDRNNKI